jgi:hypothetical protein
MTRGLLLIAVAALIPVKLLCATLPLMNPSSDSGSRFGAEVKTLVNGNVVVTDPALTVNGFPLAGAVYLFNGASGALMSTLTGSAANEMVGGGGIGVLTNGNFVAISISSGAEASLGFGPTATFVNGTTGLSGVVSKSNSLLMGPGDAGAGGSTMVVNCPVGQANVTDAACAAALANVRFPSPATSPLTASGSPRSIADTPLTLNETFNFIALPNGNYLILNLDAVSFGDGTVGVSGPVTTANSLFGGPNDFLGGYQTAGITVYSNGNYSVQSSSTGTVTFASGTTGATGQIPTSSSIAGSSIIQLSNGNLVVQGATGVTLVNGATLTSINTLTGTDSSSQVNVLTNGNYVVTSSDFGGGMGAATWVNGVTGLNGAVSAANSLVGATTNDHFGVDGATTLEKGNYVVDSPGYLSGRGAVTFVNGATGLIGVVSMANSLVGAATTDTGIFSQAVGSGYVVIAPHFDSSSGSVTFGNGATGITGVVSAANSLIGPSSSNHSFPVGVVPLTTGNYLVTFDDYGGGSRAITFGNGTTGITGVVSAANSLVGAEPGDSIGGGGLTLLPNGNYLEISPDFEGGLGAVTFGSGTTGVTGVVSSANSLVGTQNAQVGLLSNSNYVVFNLNWGNGGLENLGAATFGSGVTGSTGVVSAANSLVGGSANDQVGSYGSFVGSNQVGLLDLPDGNYLVLSPNFAGGAGAVTFGNGTTGTVGVVSSSNSLVGTTSTDHIGGGYVALLVPTGNYVVMSPFWGGGKGAVTFGTGTGGPVGAVSASNSLVGAAPGDLVGFTGWNVTYVQSDTGYFSSNTIFQSLLAQGGGSGNSLADLNQPALSINPQNVLLLPGQTTVLSNGDYVVQSPWFNGEQGAVTLGSGASGVTGVVSASNSVLGSLPIGFFGSSVTEDQTNLDKLVASGWVELHQHATQVDVLGLPGTLTVQTSPPGLQISVDGGAVKTAPQTLQLLQGPHAIAVVATQPGTAGSQSVFTQWNDGVTTASRSITVGATAASYTASFKTQYQLTILASPAGGGRVTPASGSFYDSGMPVSIGATANSGFSFTNWTGSVASASSASTTVTMNAAETVTANFAANNAGHPTFFSGEISLGNGVYYLNFPDNDLFGYYNYPSGTILFHYDMGFEGFVAGSASDIYFYDFASSRWWYTSSTLFPYLYDFTLNTWIYYFEDPKNPGHYTANPRYFSNLTTGQIFTL